MQNIYLKIIKKQENIKIFEKQENRSCRNWALITDSLMYKTEGVYEDFGSNKEMFDFSNYLTKSKY